MKPYVEVAIAFASALVDENFARAVSLLSPNLRRELSQEVLREKLYAMFRDYAEGKPQSIHCDPEHQMEEWPRKRPGDIGWVYVGIEGDDFIEAVTVVVADVDGALLIREVEWGRP